MFAPRPGLRPVPVPGPVGAALGLPAGAAAALVTGTLGGDPVIGLALGAITVAWLTTLTTPAGALVAALQSWACYDGFVLHRFGTLGGSREDLLTLGALAATAVVVYAAITLAHCHTAAAGRRLAPKLRYAPDAGDEAGR